MNSLRLKDVHLEFSSKLELEENFFAAWRTFNGHWPFESPNFAKLSVSKVPRRLAIRAVKTSIC